jgi:23S rRNA (uracil1939-C5)-methyltransferase
VRMREEVAGVSFVISPTAFFQTNVHAAETLVGLVLAAVPERARILDLYAGAGLFALPLARAGHEVVAVEENRAAVADGEASRRFNRIPDERCRFVARRVEQAVTAPARPPGVRRDRRNPGAAQHEFDAVVLDPPREGCSETVIDGVFGGLMPPGVVYISCNPEALARDLAAASDHGYRIRSLQPVDMFPHTAHVETVAVLTRA